MLWQVECQKVMKTEDFISLVQTHRKHWIDDFMCSQWSKLHLDIYKQFLWRGKQSFDFKAPGWVTRGFLHWKKMLKTAKDIYSQWSNFNDSIYVGGQDYSPVALSLLLGLYLGWVLVWKPPHPITKYRLTLASNKTTQLYKSNEPFCRTSASYSAGYYSTNKYYLSSKVLGCLYIFRKVNTVTSRIFCNDMWNKTVF